MVVNLLYIAYVRFYFRDGVATVFHNSEILSSSYCDSYLVGLYLAVYRDMCRSDGLQSSTI